MLLKALPLPLADIQTEERIPTGKELLYRADFFREGKAKVSIGVLPAIKEPATFLTLLENAVESGDRKAGYQELCDHLKFHLALCGLESCVKREILFAGQSGKKERNDMQSRDILANTAYYREILSYVQTGRDILNACPYGTPLPPFPERSGFMVKWYRENGQGSL